MFKYLKEVLNQVLKRFGWLGINLELWVSKDAQRGHFITNLIILISQKYHLNLKETSEKIIDYLTKNKNKIKKIHFENGFLYIFCSNNDFNQIIARVLKDASNFGRLQFGTNKKINYEWVSANPTGYLHIGHARNVFVGQAITNILSFVGYKVTKEFYINDHGNQIYQLGKSVFFHYQKLLGLKPKVFPELYLNTEVETCAQELFKNFSHQYLNLNFEKDILEQKKIISFAKNFFLFKMKKDLAKIGVYFDVWFSEKSLYETKKLEFLIERLKKKGVLYKKDGALWFQANKYGNQPDFVLIKSNQLSTYFAGDIMYHDDKFQRGYDLCIDLFGTDHHAHYLKIKSGLKALGWNTEKFYVDLLQMVTIVQKGETLKISKRKGTSIPLNDLIAMAELDFLRFMLLSRQKETKFVFDLNLINEKKNQSSFFYIQYAYARSFQLLGKVFSLPKTTLKEYSQLTSIYEQNLILCLYQFESVLKKAALHREPQVLVNYALNLSKCFHAFYEKAPVLNIDSVLQKQRLQLIQAFQQVLNNSLSLLGIKAKKQM